MRSSSAAVKIENLFQADHGNISHIVVDGCTITDTNRGVGIWQRFAGPSGGMISDVNVSNMVIDTRFMWGSSWWGSGEGLYVTSIPGTAAHGIVGLPGIHNVTFINITSRSENAALFSARGQSTSYLNAITGLRLINVSYTVGRWSRPENTSHTYAQHDFRPLDPSSPGGPEVVSALVDGMFFENIADARIEGGRVIFQPPAQQYWDGLLGQGVCYNISTGSNVLMTNTTCVLV